MSEEAMQVYSHIAVVSAGVLFWAGFMVFGFIAGRYTKVFNRETFSGLLMTAPSGILIYAILMLLRSSTMVKSQQFNDGLQVAAYVFLLVSAVLCLAGMIKFGKLLDELLKYKG
ncbi:MAG: hypothetical protein LLG37_02835 [Spirochaetia bacterium]|nr:hypothetical protein [Spirochaetia bacterium]